VRNSLGAGLARAFYPDNPGRQGGEKGRLAGIFATDQGRELLFGGGWIAGSRQQHASRRLTSSARIDHRSITADTLRDTAAHPRPTNPALSENWQNCPKMTHTNP